ncbi:cytochrome P450 [Xylaria sp. FL0933]|nr:cytochrome P450 [Xylaria sp. FL0933]
MGLLGCFKVVLTYLIHFVVPLLHPLRKFLDPLLVRLSDCYRGFYVISKRTYLNIWNNHVKYGAVVRLSPNRLLSNTATAVHGIRSHLSSLRNTTVKSGSSSVKALSDRSMSIFEPTILEHIDTFLELLLKSTRTPNPVDMSSHCQHLNFDIIGDLAVVQRLKLQLDNTNRTLLRLLIIAKYRVNMIMHFPPLRIFNPVLKMIPSRQARGTPPATTVCALFFYLSRNPECYRSLANEARSTFSRADKIRSGPQLSNYKYLRACIDEPLRISPPSLASLWREQSEGTGDFGTLDGHVIPKGTQVGVNIYALHHNEEWLEIRQRENPEKSSLRSEMHDAFVPFIVGPRSCAGKAMVYQEVSLIVAKTLRYFDFERNQNGRNRVDEFQLFDVFNSHHQGPNPAFKTRGDFSNDLEPHTGLVG